MYTTEYYLAQKVCDLAIVTTWMDLVCINIRGISQTENKIHIIMVMCGI